MFIQISHLNSGTGYPWDWHNKTIACLELFLKRVPSKSEDKVGDLNPMGSKYERKQITQKTFHFVNKLSV